MLTAGVLLVGGGGATRSHVDNLTKMGWTVLGNMTENSTTQAIQLTGLLVNPERVRLRWRATDPVTRSATRFTRNTDTESSAAAGRHIPWSFKGPFIPAAAALVAGAVHYLVGLVSERYGGSHIVRA